ncbi:hypothetical protein V1511DRAFT_372099 [Dipodascopsis uninucleata]
MYTGHQRVELAIDIAGNSIQGSTEITVLPTDPTIKAFRLDFRQGRVTAALVNGKAAKFDYNDLWASTFSQKTRESSRSVHQAEAVRNQLNPLISDYLPGSELVVHLPRGVKIQPQETYASSIGLSVSPSLSRHESPDIGGKSDLYNPFAPVTLRLLFRVDNPVMGLNFVHKSAKHRYDHVYTYSTPYGLCTSSWVPCVDGLWERSTWEFEFTVPKSLGDIVNNNQLVDREKEDEDTERELVVVCSGDLVQEATHPSDHSKKIVLFSQTTPVGPQHVGFAIGPFVQTSLSELSESEEEDHNSSSVVDIFAYAFPGRQDDVVNTCMFMYRAMKFFVHEYGSYPFSYFNLCFVEDAPDDLPPYCGLAIASDIHLFPTEAIDPIFTETKYLTTLLAAQWCGVNIVPKYWSSLWVTIGICRYISGTFLRKLMGNNEYRFCLKKDAEKICELDIGRAPIGSPDLEFPLDQDTLKFITLKAPVILHILDRRLTKSGGSFGLSRAIPKIFLQAMSGDLTNGYLSSSHFQRVAEKVSHSKLDAFFQEWIYGSGYPIFRITQRFNKKKMFIEMGIRQVQNVEMPKSGPMEENEFIKDAKKFVGGPENIESNVRSVFTGPMTIRIHEADGTPYEHVVNIKDAFTKLDIQYNTKYKRLRRHLRQRDKQISNVAMAATAVSGEPMDEGELDGILLHSLGDVLSSETEMEEWRLTDWTKEEEDQMTNEAFEWMRVDSDFEWICVIYINQPDYMYASQLQQDRDVVAQYECIRYFSDAKPTQIYSTILIRTLMDRRFYYGVRVEAALALAKYAIPDLDWIGRYHLLKAFQTIFCFPDSLIPQANDFSDFPTYFIQKTIPRALSLIKDSTGDTPLPIKEFLLDLLRYNDNTNNPYSDSYYIGSLMESIAESISKPPPPVPEFDFNFNFDFDTGSSVNNESQNKAMQLDDNNANEQLRISKFVEKAMFEVERCMRMDMWMPSYRNIVTSVAISIKERLSRLGVTEMSVKSLLPYTEVEVVDSVRLAAFSALLSVPTLYSSEENKGILKMVFNTIQVDPSTCVRIGMIKLLGASMGKISMHKYGGENPVSLQTFVIVEESGNEITESRKDEYRRSTVEGCIYIAREQFSSCEPLKEGLWKLLVSHSIGVLEKRIVIDICCILFDQKKSKIVVLKLPSKRKYLMAKNLGNGKVLFYRAAREPPKVAVSRITPKRDSVSANNSGKNSPDNSNGINHKNSNGNSSGIDRPSMTVTLPLPQNRIKLKLKLK